MYVALKEISPERQHEIDEIRNLRQTDWDKEAERLQALATKFAPLIRAKWIGADVKEQSLTFAFADNQSWKATIPIEIVEDLLIEFHRLHIQRDLGNTALREVEELQKRLDTERLVSWAQNEEMVDGHFTQHGLDCIEAADVINSLRSCKEN
jgi:hypothetical protein